ncbi:MAG TPA: protein translocase subunit SecD [Candidatus Babeliales bacterium]|nr:protein translocase subunit SecD [Candidatus Babeliales bacterium]
MNISWRNMAFSGLSVWVIILAISVYLLMPLRQKLTFGIDLVGGSYITIEVQTKKAVEAALLDKLEGMAHRLKGANKPTPVSKDVKGHDIVMTFNSVGEAQAAAQVLKGEKDITIDTEGARLTAHVLDRTVKQIEDDSVIRTIEVLRTRLDKMSVAEIHIARHGENHIVIELPDVSDPQQAKAMIGTPAILELKIVERSGNTADDILYEYDGHVPAGMEILPGSKENGEEKYYLVQKRASVSGKDLRDASPQFSDKKGEIVVAFQLTPEGGQKFYELTSRNYGRQLAIVLDGVVITAPTIQEPIRSEGSISKHNGYTPEEAKELSVLLKSGSFVAPVTFEEERQVGPTLGAESIRQGLISCLVGLVLLFLFSIIVYKIAGIFAFITLLANLVLILVGMAWLKATLTLPGIAGMVLTVGMAIDASILIYEHIREELSKGIALKKAVHDGFADAMRVILDANITTFIVGAVLYYFGTGPIQGFAVTIMLGIVSTLITGLFFLKSIFNFILNNFNVQKLRI